MLSLGLSDLESLFFGRSIRRRISPLPIFAAILCVLDSADTLRVGAALHSCASMMGCLKAASVLCKTIANARVTRALPELGVAVCT
ncbi:hypothetical protein FPV67DRAFT_201350 [Lyophyllum atratum]|nr:hypothetical protein FPV67DRAFT_201350 [Lyophyllum atratum]